MSKHNRYDPNAERTCRGCYKCLKTKDGVLEGKYKFTCPLCHRWYRKRNVAIAAISIPLAILAVLLLLWFCIIRTEED